MKYLIMKLLTIVIVMASFLWFFGLIRNNDSKLNDTWDKCQQQFENSGAPMEARDSMMRDCFSK